MAFCFTGGVSEEVLEIQAVVIPKSFGCAREYPSRYARDDTVMKVLIAIGIGFIAGTVYTKYEAQKLGAVK